MAVKEQVERDEVVKGLSRRFLTDRMGEPPSGPRSRGLPSPETFTDPRDSLAIPSRFARRSTGVRRHRYTRGGSGRTATRTPTRTRNELGGRHSEAVAVGSVCRYECLIQPEDHSVAGPAPRRFGASVVGWSSDSTGLCRRQTALAFYRAFYCAAWYRGSRDGTTAVGWAAKHQRKGTIWCPLVRDER